MASKKSANKAATFMMFNVTYEDGQITSNRRVSGEQLDLRFGDDLMDLARRAIEEQDNLIVERGGPRRGAIKTIAKA